jgi:hypothetical protein
VKHNQRLFVVDGIDTAAECVATGPTMEVRLPCRYVSGYFPAAGPHRDDMAARFLGDVVKSTSAAVVDLVVDFLAKSAPDQTPLASCATRDVAELELQRYHDNLLAADVTEVAGAALKYAAALLRLRAVAW